MKRLLGVVAVTSIAMTAADAAGGPSTDSRKEAELLGARQMIIEHFSQLPLEQQETCYIEVSPTEVVPAFFHPLEKIEYRWRGVRLITTEIPGYLATTSKGIAIGPPSGFPIKEIDPPVRYFSVGRDRYGGGYYDATNGILYRWRGVEFHKSELPQRAIDSKLVLDPRWARNAEVPPPAQYAARVPTQQPSRHGTPSAGDAGDSPHGENGGTLLAEVAGRRNQQGRNLLAASLLMLILGCGSFALFRRRKSKR